MNEKQAEDLFNNPPADHVSPDEVKGMEALWNQMGTLPREQPSAELRARFDPILEAYEIGKSEAAPARPRLTDLIRMLITNPLAIAGCVAVILSGVLIGSRLNPNESTGAAAAALRTEVEEMKDLMWMARFEDDSANERLNAVHLTNQLNEPTREVLEALLTSLQEDPSVNVRLAAIDALRQFSQTPDIREELAGSLLAEASPLVQISLIDLLASTSPEKLAPVLEKFLNTENLHQRVEQRARMWMQQNT